MARKKETLLIFGAHSDDFVIGAGGTVAKCNEEGKKVISVVFSYGEKSHPWLKKRETVEMRLRETRNAEKALGSGKSIFLGLNEGNFEKEFKRKKLAEKIKRIVTRNKPDKILLHSKDDPHPDHRALNKIIKQLLTEIRYKGEVYVYDIWGPNIKKGERPKLVVDISKTFKTKIKALRCFESQRFNAILPLIGSVFFKAIANGFKSNTRFAELFYRIQIQPKKRLKTK
ncbi:PIG-L deacetylase family protein [Nanoarchaeota archaeon]